MFINVTATIIILPTKLSPLSLSCFPRFHGYNIWFWRATCISMRPKAPESQCGNIQWAISTILTSSSSVFTWPAYSVLHCTNLCFLRWMIFSSSYYHQRPSTCHTLSKAAWCQNDAALLFEQCERCMWWDVVSFFIFDAERMSFMKEFFSLVCVSHTR